MQEFRDARVRAMVQHCARTVPYYRRVFAECGFRADRCQGLNDLAQLPVLTKQMVQEHTQELVSEAVDRKRVFDHAYQRDDRRGPALSGDEARGAGIVGGLVALPQVARP